MCQLDIYDESTHENKKKYTSQSYLFSLQHAQSIDILLEKKIETELEVKIGVNDSSFHVLSRRSGRQESMENGETITRI